MIDEVALGVFTHRVNYLPGLLGSLKRIGDPPCVVVCADGPINANMARLWEAFKRTRSRYWVFLDDDIEFLGGDVLGDCVRAMVRHRWAGCTIFSTLIRITNFATTNHGGASCWNRGSLRSVTPAG